MLFNGSKNIGLNPMPPPSIASTMASTYTMLNVGVAALVKSRCKIQRG